MALEESLHLKWYVPRRYNNQSDALSAAQRMQWDIKALLKQKPTRMLLRALDSLQLTNYQTVGKPKILIQWYKTNSSIYLNYLLVSSQGCRMQSSVDDCDEGSSVDLIIFFIYVQRLWY